MISELIQRVELLKFIKAIPEKLLAVLEVFWIPKMGLVRLPLLIVVSVDE